MTEEIRFLSRVKWVAATHIGRDFYVADVAREAVPRR